MKCSWYRLSAQGRDSELSLMLSHSDRLGLVHVYLLVGILAVHIFIKSLSMFLTMVLISCHYLYNAAIIGRITTLRLSINNADPSTISHLFTFHVSSQNKISLGLKMEAVAAAASIIQLATVGFALAQTLYKFCETAASGK